MAAYRRRACRSASCAPSIRPRRAYSVRTVVEDWRSGFLSSSWHPRCSSAADCHLPVRPE